MVNVFISKVNISRVNYTYSINEKNLNDPFFNIQWRLVSMNDENTSNSILTIVVHLTKRTIRITCRNRRLWSIIIIRNNFKMFEIFGLRAVKRNSKRHIQTPINAVFHRFRPNCVLCYLHMGGIPFDICDFRHIIWCDL